MKALKTEEVFPDEDGMYPESDGRPMADSTMQYRWIVKIKEGLEILYADDPDVFVAADLLWYPREGERRVSAAPDVMVALGRPRGDRGSYRQWEEGDVAHMHQAKSIFLNKIQCLLLFSESPAKNCPYTVFFLLITDG